MAIDGTTLPNTLPAGWSVYWDTSSKFFVFFPPNPYLTQTVGTLIAFTFSPGVFTVPNAPGPAFLSVREAGLIGDDSGQTGNLNIVVPTIVTFDANGGTGSMNTQSGTSATALTENAFTRTGYTFGGWAATQPEALAGQVAYANGASYPFATTTTLYAIWLVETPDDSGSASGEAASKLPVTGIEFLPVALAALLTALLGIVVAYRSWMRSRNQ